VAGRLDIKKAPKRIIQTDFVRLLQQKQANPSWTFYLKDIPKKQVCQGKIRLNKLETMGFIA